RAPRMIAGIPAVQQVADTGVVSGASVYHSPLVPTIDTNALQVQAASLNLLPVIATSVARGRYLDAATADWPVAVLGAAAAQRLGIDAVYPGERIWLGGMWFYVAGILNPAVLAPEIDTSVLVGYPAAQRYLGYNTIAKGRVTIGPPTTIYVRSQTSQ